MISNSLDHDADFQFIIIIIILFCPNLSMVNHGSRTSEYSRITIEVLERDINAHSNDPIEDRGYIYQSAFDSYTEEQQKSTNAVNVTAATATRDERVVSKRDIVDRLETKQKVCFYIAYQKVSSKIVLRIYILGDKIIRCVGIRSWSTSASILIHCSWVESLVELTDLVLVSESNSFDFLEYQPGAGFTAKGQLCCKGLVSRRRSHLVWKRFGGASLYIDSSQSDLAKVSPYRNHSHRLRA